MVESQSSDLTQILIDTNGERPGDVAKKLMPLVYDELRRLAAGGVDTARRSRLHVMP